MSWNDAVAFCEWLGEKDGGDYSLTTEAQWEFACRAGSTSRYSCGSELSDEYACFGHNEGVGTSLVGERLPNGFGLLDMHGNVEEWCLDVSANDFYANSPSDDPVAAGNGDRRMLRSGAWWSGAQECRSPSRRSSPSTHRHFTLGLRVAMNPATARLSVNINQPDATVTILNEASNADDVHEVQGKSIQVPMASGEYLLRLEKEGFEQFTEKVTIDSDDVSLSVNLAPSKRKTPLPAIAPFGPKEAEHRQQAWADHLGVPMEKTNSIGMKLRLIPPGEFMMGSSEEQADRFIKGAKAEQQEKYQKVFALEMPQHQVRLSKPHFIGIHEVTRGQFRQFVAATGYVTEAEKDGKGGQGVLEGKAPQDPRFLWNTSAGFKQPETDDHPVINVSWNDANAFCRWLSEKEGTHYSLPTEAQWEFARRSGSTSFYSCGDDDAALKLHAWVGPNSDKSTHAVGTKLANSFGLHDMHGNVMELCQDWMAADFYASSPTDDPTGPAKGNRRVLRGGVWWDSDTGSNRSACRYSLSPSERSFTRGFRVIITPPDSTLLIEVNQPGTTVTIFDETRNAEDVRKIQEKSLSVPVVSGEYWLRVEKEGFRQFSEKFTVALGEEKSFSVSLKVSEKEMPLPAVAPFGPEEARRRQQDWAKYTNMPVEATNSVGMKFRLIPPGEFMMGAADEEVAQWAAGRVEYNQKKIQAEAPQHRTRLSAFFLGMHEVSVGEFGQFVAATNYMTNAEKDGKGGTGFVDGKEEQDPKFLWNTETGFGPPPTDDHPVTNVSWNDAMAFCKWLGDTDGFSYSLATEAQWEYACRSGVAALRSRDDTFIELEPYAWFERNSSGSTHAKGTRLPNSFGLYDMLGNVQEWCADRYSESYYGESPLSNPIGPESGDARVLRGGSCREGTLDLRPTARHGRMPHSRRCLRGFRVTRSLSRSEEPAASE